MVQFFSSQPVNDEYGYQSKMSAKRVLSFSPIKWQQDWLLCLMWIEKKTKKYIIIITIIVLPPWLPMTLHTDISLLPFWKESDSGEERAACQETKSRTATTKQKDSEGESFPISFWTRAISKIPNIHVFLLDGRQHSQEKYRHFREEAWRVYF